MVKFTVLKSGEGLQIKIGELAGKESTVLNALQECAEGRCTCPTSQYEKLQSVEMTPGRDEIRVALMPKAGEVIDRQAIKKCLEYTAAEAEGKK